MPSCNVYIWTLDVEKKVILFPTAVQPTIALQFILAGSINCRLADYGEKRLVEGNVVLFYVPRGAIPALIEPGFYESLHIEISPAWLDDISADNIQIAQLISSLDVLSDRANSMVNVRIGYSMGAILKNLRACQKKGGSLQLEMHKFVLELLSEYVDEMESAHGTHMPEYTPYKKAIIRVRDYILTAPNVQQQTLGKLAIKFHISEPVLKQHFKKHFQISLSGFVRLHALTKARDLIYSTRQSIEQISVDVGYSSREALERAFKKQYGYSPSGLRAGLKR